MTTTVTLTQYLDAHRAWLKGGAKGGPEGYIEGPNNDTPFGIRFGLNHQPWCLMWAMCCAEDAGLPYEIRTAGTRYCAAWAKRKGILRPDPAPGALGLLFEGHKPGTGHAVVCEALRPGGWVSLEGNTDVRGGRTGGRCLRLARSMSAVGVGGGFIHREFYVPGPTSPTPEEGEDMRYVYTFDHHYWATDLIHKRIVTGHVDLDYLVSANTPTGKQRITEDMGEVHPDFHNSLVLVENS